LPTFYQLFFSPFATLRLGVTIFWGSREPSREGAKARSSESVRVRVPRLASLGFSAYTRTRLENFVPSGGLMLSISRREAGKLIAAGSAGLLAGAVASRGRLRGAQMIDSVVRGVQIGAQSYSFRDRPLAAALEAYRTVGLGECELYEGHVAPDEQKTKREERRQWRLTTPLSQDRKSTRLNSSHVAISYAVFCLKKKKANC